MPIYIAIEYHPRVVQVISPDLLRNVVLAAGPAQFGANLDGPKREMVSSLLHAMYVLPIAAACKWLIVCNSYVSDTQMTLFGRDGSSTTSDLIKHMHAAN